MGLSTPHLRPVHRGISDQIDALFHAAMNSGIVIIDPTYEAERLLLLIPDCNMTAAEIAELIAYESTGYSGIGVVLNRR